MRCSATTRDRVGLLDARVPFQHLGHGLTPYPYVLDFAQDAHERLLIEQLDALGVKVERRTELSRFEQQRGSVQATLRRADGSEDLCETTYLAGCDGVRSTVREGLGIGFPGGTYDQLFYVADVEAAGPATDGEVHVDLRTLSQTGANYRASPLSAGAAGTFLEIVCHGCRPRRTVMAII